MGIGGENNSLERQKKLKIQMDTIFVHKGSLKDAAFERMSVNIKPLRSILLFSSASETRSLPSKIQPSVYGLDLAQVFHLSTDVASIA